MRFTIPLLVATMLFVTTGCAKIQKPETDYAVPKPQYPISTVDYATDPYAGQGISYGGGSVTIFPIDQSAPIAQPLYQNNSNDYSYNNEYAYTIEVPAITGYEQTVPLEKIENIIYFKHGSSHLGSIDKKRIRELALQLKETGKTVYIIGYASQPVYTTKDPVQQDIVNLYMGSKRAMAVTEELYRAGVLPTQVRTISKGDAYSDGNNKMDRKVELNLN